MLKNFFASADEQALQNLLKGLSASDLETLIHDWVVWARDEQLPPQGNWTTWLMLGGRGAGKTRAGAEWVRGLALGKQPFAAAPVERIALIGQTAQDAREVMVEGVAGLLAVHPHTERPVYEKSRRRLTWPNGAIAELFSAEEPDSLRGPQFGAAWCDELAKWRYARDAFDMLQFTLRLGDCPRQLITTTPRPIALIKELIAAATTEVTRMATRDNADNLAQGFLTQINARYEGTRLGRQELDGDLIDDRPDALWNRADLDRLRVGAPPEMARIVVAVDPPVTSGEHADACGIIAAGRGGDGRAYVLRDASVQGLSPLGWAQRAVSIYHASEADRLIVEVNQGGEMAAAVLRQVEPALPIRMVRATRGKFSRAEPVAALYEQGRVAHVGGFAELEDEMCDFGPEGLSGGRSPDRVDALVWALSALMLEARGEGPRVRGV